MSTRKSPKVAIVTGASQGIGAGLTAAFRPSGYAVVGTSRSMRFADEPDFATVQGDIADIETAQLVVERALDRFADEDPRV
jgi:NAD(P)-dependent dehydrogenase (short-subunit alcohol dehydrogenase family)